MIHKKLVINNCIRPKVPNCYWLIISEFILLTKLFVLEATGSFRVVDEIHTSLKCFSFGNICIFSIKRITEPLNNNQITYALSHTKT